MMDQGLNRGGPLLPKAGALPDCATPRTVETHWFPWAFLVGYQAQRKNKNGQFGVGVRFMVTKLVARFPGVCGLFLAAGLTLAFDPHVLLLAWSDARQETVAATSRATCEAAIGSIIAGRWLADDPPAVMRCERGSAFALGSDCIASYNCETRR